MAKIILVTHSKGGVGKSTIVTSINDVLVDLGNKVQIIDNDPQRSLMSTYKMFGRDDLEVFTLDQINESKYDYILIDTPPYVQKDTTSVFNIADLIIMPCKAGAPDVQAFAKTYELYTSQTNPPKGYILMNETRDKTYFYQDIIDLIEEHYPQIPLTKNRLSILDGFKRVFSFPLKHDEKAYGQVRKLVEEIIL
jgi:chromosome partitioning protein